MWWMTGGYQISPDENEGDEGWTTLRYRKVYRQYLIPAGLVIPLAITECGLDPLVNPKPLGCEGGTWSQLGPYWAANPDSLIRYTGDPALYYFQQLEWYAKELQKDPYVVGATIFCMGNWGGAWQDFDIAGTGVATRLIEYARANPCPLFSWHDYAGEGEETPPLPEEPPASSVTPIGVHMAPILAPPSDQAFWLGELVKLGVTDVKLLDAVSDGNLGWIARLRDAGIRPIVRLYKAQQFPGRLDGELIERVSALAAVGATYVEIGNEPNLDCEWPEADQWRVDWHNVLSVATVASSWYADAEAVIARGGKPAFYAMAPTDRNGTNQLYSSIEWQKGIIGWLAANRYQQVRDWIASGKVWLAVHSSPFSRALNYDPWTIPDDMCMRGYQVHQAIVEKAFGLVPETISTECGTFSPEHMQFLQWYTYPGGLPLTEANYASCTLAMYKWAAARGLPVCTWILTDQGVADLRWKDNGWYRGTTPREVVAVLAGRS